MYEYIALMGILCVLLGEANSERQIRQKFAVVKNWTHKVE